MSYPSESTFQPQQVVCIEQANLLLLSEVIQIVPERQCCWARCLALGYRHEQRWQLLYDLRESPQLILPTSVFRAALDTEGWPLLTELWQQEELNPIAGRGLGDSPADQEGRQALHRFVRSIKLAPA